MAKIELTCPQCNGKFLKERGHYNRSFKKGAPVFCGRECSGLARRSNKTVEQKRADKSEYDRHYRKKNLDRIKRRKHEYFKRTYDPVEAAIERKKNMAKHVEYCRRPEYRKWKKRYDRKHKAKQSYGEFWECQVLTLDIRDEALSRMTDYEIRLSKGTVGKSTKRKRAYEKLNRTKSKGGPLGDVERCEVGQDGAGTRGLNCDPGTRNSSHHKHPNSDYSTSQKAG